ncbi:MAG TPA: NFACT RNA binding domain-containing protein [Longimicrobiales bacterium]
MSNAIRYDALLVRDLARELNERLADARLDAAFLDRDSLRVTLLTRASRRDATPPPSLLWQLHPASGHLTPPPEGAAPGGRVQLGTPTRIVRVYAPPDERLIVFELGTQDAPAGAARRIIIELVTNQWNAVAEGADGRITAVLRERGKRGLRAGVAYEPPPRSARIGGTALPTSAEWTALLGAVPTGERLAALQRTIAYTSALNAAFIIGDADVHDDAAALERARLRCEHLVWRAARAPALLKLDGRLQPYPRPEPGEAEPAASLLEAFAAAAAHSNDAPAADAVADQALSLLAQRLDAIDRRARRLRAQQAGALEEAERLRRHADLLLAQLHRVGRGAARVELDDFAGGSVTIAIDPGLDASTNAARLYDAARKRDRAAARVPALLRAGAGERARLEALVERVRSNTATPDELARIQPRPRQGSAERKPGALPYREYRTSGGLEVRVGRGSRANDELTFRHSSPTDIWLHARDVAGAHVILRWSRPDENPPAGAISEAAVLAALHSRARTSGVVAVDWTRRKYVRKPRKAGPGLVVPERVRTVFVEPDEAAGERMRADP